MVVYFRIGFSCKSSLFVMMIPQLFDTLLQFVSLLRLNHLISLLSAVVLKITTSNKQTTEQTNDNMPCIVGVFFSKFMITMKYLDERVFLHMLFVLELKFPLLFADSKSTKFVTWFSRTIMFSCDSSYRISQWEMWWKKNEQISIGAGNK